jgi:WD40 repeat protein/serine/threonine protein kinase
MNEVAHESSLEGLVGEVANEFTERLQRGEQPSTEDYARRHPEIADLLRQVLPALQVIGAASSSAGAMHESTPLTGVLGDFRLEREVGRGGMGIVYEAEQISLGRRVAVKVLPFAATMDPKHLQRFHNEAKAAACLHHEHIIPVYFVGCERGVHFYAMQFIEGITLAQFIRSLQPADQGAGDAPTVSIAALSTERSGPRGRDFYRQAATLIAQAADALEYAHSLGIVHRDIKPGNLLIDQTGKLWVGDFGLAKMGPDAGLTMSGDLLGTLRYMAPEQALAKHGLVDHRADVYALGATLYELLTLRPAVDASERAEILGQIAFEEPHALRKIDRTVPVELETIVLKCLAKEPGGRYATAGEMADDLGRWLEHRPIIARPVRSVGRLARWTRRNPAIAGLGALASVLLFALVVALSVGIGLILVQKDEIERERGIVRPQLYAATIKLAHQAWEANGLVWFRDLLDRHRGGPENLRGFEWHYLNHLANGGYNQIAVFTGHTGAAECLAFSPLGRLLASGGSDGTIRLWDLSEYVGREGSRTSTHAHPTETANTFACHVIQAHVMGICGLAFFPDGETLVSGSDDTSVRLWDVRTGRPKGTLAGNGKLVLSVGVSPNGRWIAAGFRGARTRIWDARDHRVVVDLSYEKEEAASLAFSPNGKLLATADNQVRIWEIPSGRQVWETPVYTAMSVAFSTDDRIVAGLGDGRVARFQIGDAQPHAIGRPHRGAIRCMAAHQPGSIVATASDDGWICLLDHHDFGVRQRLRGHTRDSSEIVFSPDGHWLASASWDGTVRLWRVDRAQSALRIPIAAGARPLGITPDQQILMLLDREKKLLLHDLETNQIEVQALPVHDIDCYGVTRDALQVAVAQKDGTVLLWDITNATTRVKFPSKLRPQHGSLQFSADQKLLGMHDGGGSFHVFDVDHGACMQRYVLRQAGVAAWSLTAAGRILIADSWGPVALVRDVRTEQAISERKHATTVSGAKFSPDAEIVVFWDHADTVAVSDSLTGREIVHLHKSPAEAIGEFAISRDGRTLATRGSGASRIKLWCMKTGLEFMALVPEPHAFVDLAFLADDQVLSAVERIDDSHSMLWLWHGSHRQ